MTLANIICEWQDDCLKAPASPRTFSLLEKGGAYEILAKISEGPLRWDWQVYWRNMLYRRGSATTACKASRAAMDCLKARHREVGRGVICRRQDILP